MGGTESRPSNNNSSEEENSQNDMAVADQTSTGKALAVAGAVGVASALAAWGISRAVSSSSEQEEDHDHEEKMMKAPGRDYNMPRKDFEEDPKTYFRNLRGKPATAVSSLEPKYDGHVGDSLATLEEKMMKAPGRDHYMPRKDFETDPKSYFRGLRGKSTD